METPQIYMLPTTLGGETTNDIIPEEVRNITTSLRHFIVEDLKTARRYLRKLDREFPIDDSTFFILNKKTPKEDIYSFIRPIKEGFSIGIMSEAGCPGIADPGAAIVSLAHEKGIKVQPLVGPSSILLALIGSGFLGQQFEFHGYLPKERKDRISKLKWIESDTRRSGKTHLFMDTPFRNMHVLDDLLNNLVDTTQICIACDITLHSETIKTMSVKKWRDNAFDLAKRPTIFAIGKNQ